MSYYVSKTLSLSFDEAVTRVTEALKTEGFGVLTEIDVSATLKQNGACNPTLAHEALMLENNVGTMLPCNVVVRDAGSGKIEMTAVDPVASMQAIDNSALKQAALQVRAQLEKVVSGL